MKSKKSSKPASRRTKTF